MLCSKLREAGCNTETAEEDADILIIETAIKFASNNESNNTNIIIIGKDIDLLVILSLQSSEKNNIFLIKPGKNQVKQKMFTTSTFIPTLLQLLVALSDVVVIPHQIFFNKVKIKS